MVARKGKLVERCLVSEEEKLCALFAMINSAKKSVWLIPAAKFIMRNALCKLKSEKEGRLRNLGLNIRSICSHFVCFRE